MARCNHYRHSVSTSFACSSPLAVLFIFLTSHRLHNLRISQFLDLWVRSPLPPSPVAISSSHCPPCRSYSDFPINMHAEGGGIFHLGPHGQLAIFVPHLYCDQGRFALSVPRLQCLTGTSPLSSACKQASLKTEQNPLPNVSLIPSQEEVHLHSHHLCSSLRAGRLC